MTSTTLAIVCTPDFYQGFAKELLVSAQEFFHPTPEIDFLLLDGEFGWPKATMCRHEVLLQNFPDTDYAYLIDADMLFCDDVGPEILPPENYGVVATQHPGYVGRPYSQLPYEKDPDSAAWVPESEGHTYYCGGFFGGARRELERHLTETVACMELDARRGRIPLWHDESAHNRVLASHPPALVLSPSYCSPEDNTWYQNHIWQENYPPRIIARDKTPAERQGR